MYYFYCPNCGFQKEVVNDELPKTGLTENTRGGYGVPILHCECEQCGNKQAGYMLMRKGDMNEKVDYRSIIGLYQRWNSSENCYF